MDELVGTLVDVELLLRVSYDLVAVCLRLLDMEGSHHAVCNFSSLWSRNSN